MAKGVEDCAFYRYSRLTSLNEVGGDPSVFAVDAGDVPRARWPTRQRDWPHAMTTLSTHDTKRGEDVRARITVLAEVPGRLGRTRSTGCSSWRRCPTRASASCSGRRSSAPGRPTARRLRERLHAYAEKAMREAGDRTTWTEPDEAYEAAVHAAVDAAFDDAEVRAGARRPARRVVEPPAGATRSPPSCSRSRCPGVPDVYQGSELWEQSAWSTPTTAGRSTSTRAVPPSSLAPPTAPTPTRQAAGHPHRAAAAPRPARAVHDVRAAAGAGARRRPRARLRPRRRGHRRHPAAGRAGAARRLGRHRRSPCPPGDVARRADAVSTRSTGERSRSPTCCADLPGRAAGEGARLTRRADGSTSGRRCPQRVRLQRRRRRRRDGARATTAGGRPTGPVPDGEVDYGYLLDDDRHAAARPAVAPPARRRARALAHLRPRGVRLERRRAGPAGSSPGRSIYELHVGTFTPEGTLDAALDRLDHLRRLGVDLVELMPVNAFNGTHNWGYDGVLLVRRPRGVRRPGGVPALRRRLPRRRARRHPGRRLQPPRPVGQLPAAVRALPEGGRATPGATWSTSTARASAEVRRYILDNVRMWFADYHVDGLRLDAVHALDDSSELHLLEEMAIEVAALSAHLRRPLTLIAESDLNDPQLVTPREAGGYGLDAQWSDDFHHAVHVALTGETARLLRRLRAARRAGQGVRAGLLPRRHLLVVPRPRPRRARSTPQPMPTWRLVVCSQNHDQIGNRAARRPAHRAPRRRPARVRGAAHAGRAVHADAVPGRGVGGLDAVPVLHLAPRARARHGPRPRAGSRSSSGWAGTRPSCPTRRTPATFERSKLDWSELDGRAARAAARGLPPAGRLRRELPELTDPAFASDSLHRRRGRPAVHDAPRRAARRGQLRRGRGELGGRGARGALRDRGRGQLGRLLRHRARTRRGTARTLRAVRVRPRPGGVRAGRRRCPTTRRAGTSGVSTPPRGPRSSRIPAPQGR